MPNSNKLIFDFLKVVAWIIFIGLCVEAGGIITNAVFSFFKPELISRLYKAEDLSAVHAQSPSNYYILLTFWVTIASLKAYLFYFIIKLLSTLDLVHPFSQDISDRISKLSYIVLAIGLLSAIANQLTERLKGQGIGIGNMQEYWNDAAAFLMMAAIIYILAQIFKRGIELQTENELTI